MFRYSFLLIILLFTHQLLSCNLFDNAPDVPDNDNIIYIDSLPIVAFQDAGVEVVESNDGMPSRIEVVIVCDTIEYAGASVTVAVDNACYEQHDRALEGIDFNIVSSKTVTFDREHLLRSIVIETINNDLMTGDKMFDLVIVDTLLCCYEVQPRCVVTIRDDDTLLDCFIGDFYARAHSCSFSDMYQSEQFWKLTFTPFETSDSCFYIAPICVFKNIDIKQIAPVVSYVNHQTQTLTVPYGQLLLQSEISHYLFVGFTDDYTPIFDGVATARYAIDEHAVTISFNGNYGVVKMMPDNTVECVQVFEKTLFTRSLL